MKRYFLSLICGGLICSFVLLATGCSSASITDEYASYRDKTSAELFADATTSLNKKHYAKASEELSALDAIYPFGPNSKQVKLDMIYANYKNNDLSAALTAAERYLRLYPSDSNADYAYYMKGCIEYDQGTSWLKKKFKVNAANSNLDDKKIAFKTFNTLVKMYPHSIYAADATARMRYLRDLFAEQELMVAKSYYERKAYVAAANRASIVVQHYANTSSVKDALTLLAQSYDQLGLATERDKTTAILNS